MKSEYIVIRSTPEFKKRVKEVAANENKSMSDYINNLILADLKKKES